MYKMLDNILLNENLIYEEVCNCKSTKSIHLQNKPDTIHTSLISHLGMLLKGFFSPEECGKEGRNEKISFLSSF